MNASVPRCPGCGLVGPDAAVPAPPQYLASSRCYDRYGELLARSYAGPDRPQVHQLIVDAYVAQHPTTREDRHVRQLALCLMTLDLFLEQGHDSSHGPALHKRMIANLPQLEALDPPAPITAMTVETVLAARNPAHHRGLVRTWARVVWNAWRPHHETVRQWNNQALGVD